jgi:tetratricopeptide (TPR) repeat protein
LGFVPTAEAALTLWERARSPQRQVAADLLTSADRARETGLGDRESEALTAKLNERSAVLLELAGASKLGDADVLFLQGACWANAGSQPAATERSLRAALALAPEHPAAAGALSQLAEALGILGKRTEQRQILRQALLRETDPELRQLLYVEYGRSYLLDQQFREAIEVLNTAGTESPGSRGWAFAEWSQAVAYDLSFDFPAAAKHVLVASQARFGESGQVSLLDVPEVAARLGPQKYYYFALELTAKAALLPVGDARDRQLAAAQLMWLGYQRSVPASDPWLGRVEAHLSDGRRALDAPADEELDRDALTPPDF